MCTGGKYPIEYVHKLQNAVARNLSKDHRFVCIAEKDIPGVETITHMCRWPGWWNKLNIFALSGPVLWLDLDVVITGPLDPLCHTDRQIRVARNWAQSGHGGCQSSVMFWNGDLHDLITKRFHVARHATPERFPWPPLNRDSTLWGDQEYLTSLRDLGWLKVDYFDDALVKSYKYHCRDRVPQGCSVVCFHGKPDPHEVSDEWVKTAWK